MNEEIYLEEDEITLKDIVLKLKEFWAELLLKWLWILLIALPIVLWFFYNAYSTPIQYQSELVFMINEEKGGGGGGGIAAIAGQFGFNVGAGGGGEYNKEKIITLSKSGKIIHPVILDSMEIKGKKDLVGNHLIRLYELHDVWRKSPNEKLKTFFFTRVDSVKNLSVTEKTALKSCYALITGTKKNPPLSNCGYDESSGILNITTQSISEELSLGLTDKIFNNLSTFYVKQQIEPQKKSFESIKAKADSLNSVIRGKEYELAKLKDGTNSVFLRQYRLKENRLQRELPSYASQYATLLQNVENADFILKNKTPFFQIIDYPFFPLAVITTSVPKAVLLGGILGILAGALIIIIRKILIDAMKD
jgi:hypothetical protein